MKIMFFFQPFSIRLFVKIGRKAGEHEGGGVHSGGVVLEVLTEGQLLHRPEGLGEVILGVLGAHEGADRPAGVGGDVDHGVLDVIEANVILQKVHHLLDQRAVQPDGLSLVADNPTRAQDAEDILVELRPEQLRGGSLGVGGVDNDDIVRVIRGVLDEGHAVAHLHRHAGVIVATGDLWEVQLTLLNHTTVNIDQLDGLNNALFRVLVLDDFAHDTAVAATNNEYLLRLAVATEGQVAQHFVIDELVVVGELYRAVEGHHLPPRSLGV
ncbi:hypothetical protein AGDE_04824 [Angomonas deanei]|nr:hypothetical protein AGDE_04824 [Angomonas deanei]|eukprot:EPY39105.1 hypothetical protein AGDE_04824 [Angomonas deanei]